MLESPNISFQNHQQKRTNSGRQLPFYQPKLTINEPNDSYEREADFIAERVMRIPASEANLPFFRPAPIAIAPIQRKCKGCEEEDNMVQMKRQYSAGEGMNAPANVHDAISSTGQPLDPATKGFMEARFGYDFGNVRIHDDFLAHNSSADLNAFAYTHANHIVFGPGSYKPTSRHGKQLLAHELVHVIQQRDNLGNKNNLNRVQRLKMGTSNPPELQLNDGSMVQLEVTPEEELPRVTAAVKLVEDVVNNEKEFNDCHSFFTKECPNKESLKQTFDKVVLWKYPNDIEEMAGARAWVLTENVSYTYKGDKSGTDELAKDLFHELMHTCGITGPDHHLTADVAKIYCMGPGKNKISFQGGILGDVKVAAFSYSRFLTEWYRGRLKPSVGVDVNFGGLATTGDILTVNTGIHARSNLLWGGERYGGLTLSTEAGLTFGHFREMKESEAKESWGPGIVLKLAIGAEFVIPDFLTKGKLVEGRGLPAFIELGYKYIKPINSKAEEVQSIALSLGIYL